MNDSGKFIIAIDGPSGTGKSTTAKIIAKTLNITYLDTGAMYRAITFAALKEGITPTDDAALRELLDKTTIDFGEGNKMYIDGVCRESEIRGPEVSSKVSPYSANPTVRSALTEKQRQIGSKQSCILDGRDIGTVVFPNAEYKFFLVTDLKVRAERRYQECLERGEKITLEEVEKNLAERDAIDSSRATAPLKKADDAIEIDTTHISIQQQVQQILDRVGVVAQ
ncbi:MAG: (d)CMP kinase [Fibrobacter sp.]|nr:(d)CMP kinase [Fibrobacter sp.]